MTCGLISYLCKGWFIEVTVGGKSFCPHGHSYLIDCRRLVDGPVILPILRLLFIHFSGIIPAKYIAGVMNDGRFSGHLITETTQIVMMDEWTPDSLSCEDAKRILQGKCFR